MQWENEQHWLAQFGSLRLYRGVGHSMMERMGWWVGSSLGKQHSWQRARRPVQLTSQMGRQGLRGRVQRMHKGRRRSSAEPLRRSHWPLVFIRSVTQRSARAAALVARRVDVWCVGLIRAMRRLQARLMRFQARLCGGLAADAAWQGAVIAMEVAGAAADCVAVAVAEEAAVAAQAALRSMGVVLASLFARVRRRHRSFRLQVWYQRQQWLVNKSRPVLCSTVERGSEGCILLSCPAGSQCVDITWCVDLVFHDVRALRPTEACSTSVNLSKRPKI